MSKIPVPFDFIPKFFRKQGILNPLKKESYKNRLAYIYWALSKCYTIPTIQDGVNYDAFEFSCTYEQAERESGLTTDQIRYQEEYFTEKGFLIKVSNQIKNRSNFFKWNMTKLSEGKILFIQEEKIASTDNTPNQNQAENIVHNSTLPQTNLREKTSEKSQTKIVGKNNFKSSETPKPIEKFPNQTPNQNLDEIREKTAKNPKPIPKPNPTFYKSDRAIESSLDNSDNVAKPRVRENLSLSSKGQITAFFNPRSYRLRNGEPLSLRTQNAFCKYSPNEQERLLANVQYYEEYVDSGGHIKRTHEAFLQHCINEDRAMKKDNSDKNDLYARFMKSEYEAYGIEILQTVVKLKKSEREEPHQISKELPPTTFSNIIENYINTYYPKALAYAN